MSPAATQRKRTGTRSRASRKRKSAGWLGWWPLVLALIATPFAVRAASVMVLSGPGALRLLYPFVVLVQTHASGTFAGTLAPEQRATLAEWMMWAQFPLYGLVASLVGRWRGIGYGLLTVVLLHAVAVLTAIVFPKTLAF